MLVVSDTSFCSNNLKNVCFIFKTKFRWHSLDAAVETVSLFLERIKKHLHDRVTPVQQHRKCLCLCTQFVLWEDTGEFFNAYVLGASLPPRTQILWDIWTPKGLHQLSCDEVHGSPALLKPRPISHGTQWIFTESFGDLNLLTTYWWSPKTWCAKMSEQLTLVTSYIRIYGSNHGANELRSCSTPSGAGRFVGG